MLGDQETGAMVSEAVEAAPESTNGPGLGQKHAARSSAAGEPQQRLTDCQHPVCCVVGSVAETLKSILFPSGVWIKYFSQHGHFSTVY